MQSGEAFRDDEAVEMRRHGRGLAGIGERNM
jgi:hypothetical protein